MKITGFTVVRNEEELVAKTILHLREIADEVVCVVQRSFDATFDIALDLQEHVDRVTVVPRQMSSEDHCGWEFGIPDALDHATHNWCFGLNADETYVGVPLRRLAEQARDMSRQAVSIPRLHAVALPGGFFKREEYSPRVRLLSRVAVPMDFDWALHRGLDQVFDRGDRFDAAKESARIIEYKGMARHYRGQLFTYHRGVLNEKKKCEKMISRGAKRVAKAMWGAYWR